MLFVLLGAISIAAFPLDGTYVFDSIVAGAVHHTSEITVRRSADGIAITEHVPPTEHEAEVTASTTLAPDLTPTAYEGRYATDRGFIHMVTTFRPDAADERTDVSQNQPDGGAPKTATVASTFAREADSQFSILDPGQSAGFFALPAQLHVAGLRTATVLLLVSRKTTVATISPTAGPPPAGVPSTDVALTLTGAGIGQIVEWYSPTTYVVDLVEFPAQNAVTRLHSSTRS